MDARLRNVLHAAAVESPAAWLFQAYSLREASKRVDWINGFFTTGENASYVMEYRLLMALSIENLIKGILVAHRLRACDMEPLRGLFSHKLARLVAAFPPAAPRLSAQDLEILNDLTAYIEWAGRYPFPKESSAYTCDLGHGSRDHDTEIRLWGRLFDHLRDIGWLSKGEKGQDGWFYLFTRFGEA